MRSRLCRPEEVEILPQLPRGELGGETARSFRSPASRYASVDFTTFPLSAFGAMAEVVEEVDGVGGAGGDVGAERCSLSLSQLWEGEGAAEISEIGSSNRRMGELPLFPLLIKRDRANVPHF